MAESLGEYLEGGDAALIAVEVAYATPARQEVIGLRLSEGSVVLDALNASGMDQIFPEIDYEHADLGIFGKATTADAALRDGDRVEIYRPLLADPKEVRRRLAAEGKTMGKKRAPATTG